MRECVTRAFGLLDGRLDWCENGIEPYSSIGGVSAFPVVASVEKRFVRNSKRVSISRLKAIVQCRISAPTPKASPNSCQESDTSQKHDYAT